MNESSNAEPNGDQKPYVGLDHYEERKAPYFFGREIERDLIVENLRASRLTLLYGSSGVGKSSVLHAGVAHRLHEYMKEYAKEYGSPEFVVVTFRDWRDDPLPGLLRAAHDAVAAALKPRPVADPPGPQQLAEAIKGWTERHDIELLFILDQFEEYFYYHAHELGDGASAEGFEAGTFAGEFTRALNDSEVRAKFLVSLRDDALSKFDRFKPLIPHLFDNLLRLRRMNEEAARRAIEGPIDRYNELLGLEGDQRYSVETKLADDVLAQLRARRDGSGAGGEAGIEAAYLQLVMTELWETETESGSRVLRQQTLKDLKGVTNIVQTYLDDALASLMPEQAQVAYRIFDYLVTPSGAKVAYFESDLIGKTKFTREQVGGVLDALSGEVPDASSGRKWRILRPVESPPERRDERRFEIFHDLLAQPIINWQTQHAASAEAAAETAAKLEEAERVRREEQAEAERRQREEQIARKGRRLRRGIAALSVLLLGALGLIIFAGHQYWQAKAASAFAKEEQVKAEVERGKAVKALEDAEKQRRIADMARKEAEEQKDKAVEAREDAEKQKGIAEDERKRADKKAMEASDREREAVAARRDVEKALRDVEKEREEANRERRFAEERLLKIGEIASELKKLSDQTTDPATKERLKQIAEVIVSATDMSARNLSKQEEEQIEPSQREGAIGRPAGFVEPGDTIRNKLWANGRTLRIRFLGGSSALRQRVERVAQEWTQYANIKFVFDNSPDAEIRISFKEGEGSWSYIGTDALVVPRNQPTMNFGWFTESTPEKELRRVTLSQFGHALGLINEHQNPNANIPWNKEAVYRFYVQSQGWSRGQVDANIFGSYRGRYREFDPRSIMMDPIPRELLRDPAFEVGWNTELSESDKKFIRELYPPTN